MRVLANRTAGLPFLLYFSFLGFIVTSFSAYSVGVNAIFIGILVLGDKMSVSSLYPILDIRSVSCKISAWNEKYPFTSLLHPFDEFFILIDA